MNIFATYLLLYIHEEAIIFERVYMITSNIYACHDMNAEQNSDIPFWIHISYSTSYIRPVQ